MGLNDKVLMEKMNQLNKAIEIVGGKSLLKVEDKDNTKLLNKIIEKAFNGEVVKFEINNKNFTIAELLKTKQNYEIFFLKNKLATLQGIVYKIKKYNTELDSVIRKYKKTRGLEEYNKIYSTIEKTYRLDINKLVLKEISIEIVEKLTLEEQEIYFGEYLNQKKKQIVDGVISKMGIV